MGNIRLIAFLLAISCLCLTGCIKQKDPTVSLLNSRFMNTNTTIDPGGVLRFKWMAEKGKSDLESFTIQVNGDDLGGFPRTSIAPDIYLDSTILEGPAAEGDYTYSFVATDVDGNFGENYIVVTVQ